jgi:hypothetical protein
VEEITKERKQKIITELHNCPVGDHQGIQRTIESIKLYLSWPGLEQDVTQYIKQCRICQVSKETRPNVKLPLTITDTKEIPWEKIYLDIIGLLSTAEINMKYVLTCQNNLSKYLIAIPIGNQTADKVTEAFVKTVILVYGIPNEIQGANVISDMFKRICKSLKIEKINTTAYHAESNEP